jgi:hypothetical protein
VPPPPPLPLVVVGVDAAGFGLRVVATEVGAEVGVRAGGLVECPCTPIEVAVVAVGSREVFEVIRGEAAAIGYGWLPCGGFEPGLHAANRRTNRMPMTGQSFLDIANIVLHHLYLSIRIPYEQTSGSN